MSDTESVIASDDPTTALVAPCAPQTTCLFTGLGTALPLEAAQTIEFPWPVVVVGFRPTVKTVTFVDGVFGRPPDLDDILVKVEIDRMAQLTDTASNAIINGVRIEEWVPLGDYNILAPRLFIMQLASSRPTMKISFMSRYSTATGTGLPGAVSISFSAFWRRLHIPPTS